MNGVGNCAGGCQKLIAVSPGVFSRQPSLRNARQLRCRRVISASFGQRLFLRSIASETWGKIQTTNLYGTTSNWSTSAVVNAPTLGGFDILSVGFWPVRTNGLRLRFMNPPIRVFHSMSVRPPVAAGPARTGAFSPKPAASAQAGDIVTL